LHATLRIANSFHDVPQVDFLSIQNNDQHIQFGDYGLIASQSPVERVYAETKLIGKPGGPAAGETVWIRGRIASVRAKGNACFLVIRAGSFYTIQACHFKDKAETEQSKALLKFVAGLTLESIVDIQGVVATADVKSCSQKNVEIQIRKIFAVSRAPASLPFLLEDAARSEEEIEATAHSDRPLVGVTQVRRGLLNI
jgi:aspartyl-tRNA synthetase